IRAELPLTTSTVSPTPASTVSTATRYPPSAFPRGSTGRTTSSLLLTRRGSFRVATTVPTIRARSMRLGSGFGVQRSGFSFTFSVPVLGSGSRSTFWFSFCVLVLVLDSRSNENQNQNQNLNLNPERAPRTLTPEP